MDLEKMRQAARHARADAAEAKTHDARRSGRTRSGGSPAGHDGGDLRTTRARIEAVIRVLGGESQSIEVQPKQGEFI